MSASPSRPATADYHRPDDSDFPDVEFKDPTLPPILNLAEAAVLVRCSRAHLCNVVNGKVRGIPRLPTVRIGRRVLFRRESLEQWLREVEVTGIKRATS
jgi:hypothetical protein